MRARNTDKEIETLIYTVEYQKTLIESLEDTIVKMNNSLRTSQKYADACSAQLKDKETDVREAQLRCSELTKEVARYQMLLRGVIQSLDIRGLGERD